jgi:hypothetical protein
MLAAIGCSPRRVITGHPTLIRLGLQQRNIFIRLELQQRNIFGP